MTCQELTLFLDDYLAGTLGADVRGRFEAHLAECRDCLTYLRDYRDTVALLHDLGREENDRPTEVPPELVRAIAAARKPGRHT